MTLPQLPTDNLYKFMFLAGLTIMGLSSILYVQKYREAYTKLDRIKVDMLKSELAFYKDSANLAFELILIDEYLKEDSLNINDLQKSKSNKKRIPIKEINSLEEKLGITSNKLIETKRNLLETEISSHVSSSEIDFKLKEIKGERNFLLWISIFCGISFLTGLYITISGYNSWKLKVQNLSDEKLILELEKLKSEINQQSKDD